MEIRFTAVREDTSELLDTIVLDVRRDAKVLADVVDKLNLSLGEDVDKEMR